MGSSGEIACLPTMCPGFDSQTRRHMWVEFVWTAMKCTKNYNACAQPLCCSLNLLFSDVAVAVAVVVFLRTFALIVYAYPYCARKFTCHVMRERGR